MEYELPESKKKEYSATFEYRGVYYHMIGIIEKADFEEILKNLHFLLKKTTGFASSVVYIYEKSW